MIGCGGQSRGQARIRLPGKLWFGSLARMRSDVVLVTCVYEKLTVPAVARNLYTGPYFDRLRRYAEAQAVPWFIVSAEHGLVRPADWLAPSTPTSTHRARSTGVRGEHGSP